MGQEAEGLVELFVVLERLVHGFVLEDGSHLFGSVLVLFGALLDENVHLPVPRRLALLPSHWLWERTPTN